MILRGLAARWLLSLTMFALTVAVVAGTVVAVGFSRLTSVSEGSAAALLLLGLVGLAAQSAESVRRRGHDLALARMRGRGALRLLYFALAEPTMVVVSGAAAGVAVGWFVGGRAVDAWLPAGATFEVTGSEWRAAGIVTGACLLIVGVTSWRLMSAPLLEQLTAARRPRAAGTGGLFVQLLLVIGAVVAIYQAHQAARSRVDWVSLMSPAVVGMAAAQLLLWLLMAVFAFLVPRTRGAGLGWFITLRRLLRRADSLALIRIVVAAGVLVGVAASATTAAQGWRDQRAKLQVGAPLSYRVDGGALRAYAAAHRADPEGQWLLPVAAYTTDSSQGARRVFVDASRWKPVVGDFFSDTSAAPLTAALEGFPVDRSRVFVTGGSVSVTVSSESLPRAHQVGVSFQYVNDIGDIQILDLPLRPSTGVDDGNGQVTFTRALGGCHVSCTLVEIDISGYTRGSVRLVEIGFAGEQALAPAAGIQIAPTPEQFLKVDRVGTGVDVRMRRVPYYLGLGNGRPLGTFRNGELQRAVATPRASFVVSTGPPSVPGVDGTPRPVHVVGSVPALPFVGTRGVMLDLAQMLQGAGGSVPGTEALVLARADTPPGVLNALRREIGTARPMTYERALGRLDDTSRAQGTRLYLVIAGFAALIALISLASAIAQQRPERRQEAASLRSAGVPAGQISAAYRREALVLGVATLVGTVVACWASCRVLLDALPLVSGWAFAPPLDASPRLNWILATALIAAVAVAGLAYLAFRRVARMSAPRILREDIT